MENIKNQNPILLNIHIHREVKFGGVEFEFPLDKFNALGFDYGDSLDISFSNGGKLVNIPYYDNFYSAFDAPMVCGYPTFTSPRLTYNMTRDAWYVHNLDISMTANISLNTKAAFLDTQENLSMNNTENRKDYESDEAFANFRVVETGKLKNTILYRGASPCDLEHNRFSYVDRFMEEAKINFVLSLADTQEELDEYSNDENITSPYFKYLNSLHHIYPVNIHINYRKSDYKEALGKGLKELIKHDGPYMVYCSLGKDRTGFVCTLLECLCYASYKEMEKEYMQTHKNFYGIDEDTTPEKYKAVSDLYFKDMIRIICNLSNDSDLLTANYHEGAIKYLKECNLTTEEINILQDKLCK